MKPNSSVPWAAAALVLLFSITVAVQATAGPIKWSQPIVQIGVVPSPSGDQPLYTGWDELSYTLQFSGSPPMAADDWQCTDNLPVTDIHWWGSYYGWSNQNPPGPLTGFIFTMYNDVPAGQGTPYSHPGSQVWTFTATTYQEAFVGYDGTISQTGQVSVVDSTFFYSVDIPQLNWFYQQSQPGINTTYWLSIQALMPAGSSRGWGWKTRPHFFQDDATRLAAEAPVWDAIHGPDGASWDMTFELSTVPEPSSLIMLGGGLIAAAAALRRRR